MTWDSPKMSLSQLFVRFWVKEVRDREVPGSCLLPCGTVQTLDGGAGVLYTPSQGGHRFPSQGAWKRQRSNTGRRSREARGWSPGGEGRASYISEKQPGVPAARSLTPGLRLHSSPLQPPTPLGASWGSCSPDGAAAAADTLQI